MFRNTFYCYPILYAGFTFKIILKDKAYIRH